LNFGRKERRATKKQGYAALGGVGEWIVGSLKYLQLVGTVVAGARSRSSPRNPFKIFDRAGRPRRVLLSVPAFQSARVACFATYRSSTTNQCRDRAKLKNRKLGVLCGLRTPSNLLLVQRGNLSLCGTTTREVCVRIPRVQALLGARSSELQAPWSPKGQAAAPPVVVGASASWSSRFKYRYKLVRPIPRICAARKRLPWHMSSTRWICTLRTSSSDSGRH
jgi:hypothetical protein